MLVRILLCLLCCSVLSCGGNTRAPVEDRIALPQGDAYTVRKGDTLYSIAFRYGMDFRNVAAANGIQAPYTIYPGQNIYVEKLVLTGRAIPTTPPATESPTQPIATTRPKPILEPAPIPPAPVSVPSQEAIAEQPAVTKPVTPAVPVPVAPVAKPAPQGVKGVKGAGGEVKVWLWPSTGRVTRGYSQSVHKGIDIAGARGDPIVAVAAGKVVYAGTGIVGFGELLIIKHNDVYLSAYGHNDRLLVSEGEEISAGQKIAEKGSSGTDTVKLHFEIRKEGKPIDPQRLLPKR